MSALPKQVQIECSECGADIIEDTEWVLEVGSENLICEDCYEAEQEGYLYPEPEPRGDIGLTEVILEIGKWLVLPFLIFVIIEGFVPGGLPLIVIPIWGIIGGAYVTYFAHAEKSWLAAVIGLWVLVRSIIVMSQMI
jgi:hypothetical protein